MVKKSSDELNMEKLRHKNKMQEIKYEFDCRIKIEHIRHENDLESQRIKNASIQRSIAQKQHGGAY